jgi:hypothetical protein
VTLSRPNYSPESFELRVQSLQLDAGVGGFELPVGLGMVLVSVVLPCVDFAGEDFLVGDAAVQTLGRENAELGFGHVEPAAVVCTENLIRVDDVVESLELAK